MPLTTYAVRRVLAALKQQSKEHVAARKQDLLKVLRDLGDFYLELKWDFHSWIPLLSRMLPSDVCKIYKRGTSLRLDTTLVDFREKSWQRGDVSFVYESHVPDYGNEADGRSQNSSASGSEGGTRLTILDRVAGVYQRVKYDNCDKNELEEEVDVLCGNDLVAVNVSTKTISFQKCVTGWIFRQHKTEKIGDYVAEYYNINGLCIESRKRREHLNADTIRKNKALVTGLHTGRINENDLNARDFPLSLDTLLNILEVVAPFRHLNKLRNFCEMRMPPGFPVKLEVPLFPTITAIVTFAKFEFVDNLPESLFEIPDNFTEDPTRFPDL